MKKHLAQTGPLRTRPRICRQLETAVSEGCRRPQGQPGSTVPIRLAPPNTAYNPMRNKHLTPAGRPAYALQTIPRWPAEVSPPSGQFVGPRGPPTREGSHASSPAGLCCRSFRRAGHQRRRQARARNTGAPTSRARTSRFTRHNTRLAIAHDRRSAERTGRQVLHHLPLRARQGRRPRRLPASTPRRSIENGELTEKIIRKLRARMMPPVRRAAPGRCDGDGDGAHARGGDGQAAAAATPRPGWRPFQRLNRAEYAAAVEDLHRPRRRRQRLAAARHDQRRLRQRRRRPELLARS